jgi:hypothetical protein
MHTKTLSYKLKAKEKQINFPMIFKKFKEHELEKLYNENLQHILPKEENFME